MSDSSIHVVVIPEARYHASRRKLADLSRGSISEASLHLLAQELSDESLERCVADPDYFVELCTASSVNWQEAARGFRGIISVGCPHFFLNSLWARELTLHRYNALRPLLRTDIRNGEIALKVLERFVESGRNRLGLSHYPFNSSGPEDQNTLLLPEETEVLQIYSGFFDLDDPTINPGFSVLDSLARSVEDEGPCFLSVTYYE